MKVFLNYIVLNILFILLARPLVYGQGDIHINNAILQVGPENTLHIKGSLSFKCDTCDNYYIGNQGSIYVENNIINSSLAPMFKRDSKLTIETGKIVLHGLEDQEILGDSIVNFRQLIIDKSTGEVLLESDILVSDSLKLNKGRLFLNDRIIHLGNFNKEFKSNLIDENEDNYIYDLESGKGILSLVLTGQPITSSSDFIGLDMKAGTSTVDTLKVKRGHARHGDEDSNSGPGDGSINRYFDISTGNDVVLESTVFEYLDHENPRSLDENEFSLWVSYDSASHWLNKWNSSTTNNPLVNRVEGLHNEKLSNTSRITIAPRDCKNPPKIDFKYDTLYLCEGDSLILETKAGDLPHVWYTKTNPTLIISNQPELKIKEEGLYIVEVRDSKGCITVDSVNVLGRPNPVVEISAVPPHLCDQESFQFDAVVAGSEDGLSYLWNFGDPDNASATSTSKDPTFKYNSFGKFSPSVKVTSRYGCSVAVTKSVDVLEIPRADFTVDNACVGLPLKINKTVQYQTERTLNYTWIIDGNETGGIEAIPDIQFDAPGEHTIQLIVAPATISCADTVSKTVTIYPVPEMDIEISTPVCQEELLTITNQSPTTTGINWKWDFDDGEQSTLKTPEKKYSKSGNYMVTVVASTGFGCSLENTYPIEVIGIPNVDFSVNTDNYQACLGEYVQFDVEKPLSGGNDFFWSFGNGTTSQQQTERILYQQEGKYEVSLKVTNSFGCAKTKSKFIQINPIPIVDFVIADACKNKTVNLMNQSVISSGRLEKYNWNFGNEGGIDNFSTDQNPLKSYSSPGSYTVSLEVTSAVGCTGVIAKEITIFDAPELNLGDVVETCGSSLRLDGGNEGSSYLWSTGENNQEIRVYANGIYWVEVENENGCKARDEVTVVLHSELNPVIKGGNQFCDRGILDAGYPGAQYKWSTNEDTRYIEVDHSGTYSVEIIDQNGCTGEASINVQVNASPLIDLEDNIKKCSNEPILLDAGNPGSSFEWSTGEQSQAINAINSGIYQVKVTNSGGCSTIKQVKVDLYQNKPINLPETMEGCEFVRIDAGEGFDRYEWDHGSVARIVRLESSGNYHITAYTTEGCVSEKDIQVTVNPIPYFSLGNDQKVCFGQSVYLTSGLPDMQYEWSNGSYDSDLFVSQSGTYSLIVTDKNGCSFTDEVNVEVYERLMVDLPDERMICSNQHAQLSAGDIGNKYKWYLNNAELTAFRDTPVITIDEPGIYEVVVTNDIGCQVTDVVRIYETTNYIEANFLVNSLANAGDTLHFVQLTHPAPTWYQWSFGDGSTSYRHDPEYVYFKSGTYNVSLVVSNDICLDTLMKEVVIQQLKETKEELKEELETDLLVEVLEFKLYPNPTKDKITLSVRITKEVEVIGEIVALNGITRQRFTASGEDIKKEIDLSALPQGVYIIRVNIGNLKITTNRILKL